MECISNLDRNGQRSLTVLMKKQIITIMFSVFIVFVGFGIVIPVMPEIITSSGASNLHLGFLLSLFSIVSFFLSPIWGALSDKHGRRPVMISGLIGYTVSFLIFALSQGDLLLMYLSRIIGGLFSGAVMSCAVAYVSDISTEEQRTKMMGFVGMSIGLGFIFGPAIGGMVSSIDLFLPFWLSAMLTFLVMLGVIFVLPESNPPEKRKPVAKTSRWAAFSSDFTGAQKNLYILSFLTTALLASLEATFQFFVMEHLRATPYEIGVMFAVCGVAGALVQGGYIRRVKKGMEPATIRIGFLVTALGFALLLMPVNIVAMTIFLSIFGIGNALVRPCVTSLITQNTSLGRGAASGLNSSMDSLGRILGPLVGSFAFHYHSSLPFVLGAVVSVCALFFLAGFIRLRGKQEQEALS
ncbi:MAG TPA: MFS transporter [Candidatus Bathyarchaeia archaeon]|nr:MFS transporter [Candidatus Bathyarchaeia archaeon]